MQTNSKVDKRGDGCRVLPLLEAGECSGPLNALAMSFALRSPLAGAQNENVSAIFDILSRLKTRSFRARILVKNTKVKKDKPFDLSLVVDYPSELSNLIGDLRVLEAFADRL